MNSCVLKNEADDIALTESRERPTGKLCSEGDPLDGDTTFSLLRQSGHGAQRP
jgi:hypothetical protein